MRAPQHTNGDPELPGSDSDPLADLVLEDPPRRRVWPLRLLWMTLLLAGIALLVFPIQFPSFVSAYGRIKCAHEWVLLKGVDGQLSASVFNYETGVNEGYRASSFDRSSSVYFTLRPAMIPGRAISQGDTVGIVSSSETQERLVSLNGQLATAEGLLAVNASGEKAVVVKAAEQRLAIAERKKSEQEKVLARAKALFAQGLLPVGQYEAAENAMLGAYDDVAMRSAALEEARSGAKPEQLQLVHSNIAALKQEIAALEQRAATLTITAPISGRIVRSSAAEVLLTIADTSRYVAMIPVRLSDLARVALSPDARVTFRGLTMPLAGRITAIDQQVTTIGTERVVIATAVLDRTSAGLVSGLPVRCEIACPPVTALAVVRQFLLSLVS